MARRHVLGAAVGAGALALSGCNPLRPSLEKQILAAVRDVPGVERADLTAGREAELRPLVSGTITVAGTGDEAVSQFDAAMRAVVTTIHDYSRSERDGGRGVGGVTAVDASGRTLDATALITVESRGTRGFPSDGSGLGDVTAADFYEKYGLTV